MFDQLRDEIHLWVASEHDVRDIGLLDEYRGLLDIPETARYQRFIFSKHRHRFLVSRALVRSVLAQYLGLADPASLVFEHNPHGKPALAGRQDPVFNLSHTEGMIVLAVTAGAALGVDVEYMTRKADIQNLAERYFSPGEVAALLDLPVADWNQRFFDLWTLKEAYLKARGAGLSIPLRAFSFTLTATGIDLAFSPELADRPEHWHFWQLALDPGYRVSLAQRDGGGNGKTLVIRRGLPLREFTETELAVVRRSEFAGASLR